MNYNFWNDYNDKIKKEILDLCKEKSKIRVDLHMHSNYSSDGKQTIEEIIENTKDKFDIIAITDHDSVDVYNDLYNIIKNGHKKPIIIPGIEFTTDNREYGNQAHIVQLFINPCDEVLKDEVKKNYEASFNRSKKQLERLKYNKGLEKLLERYNITLSYDEYIDFLNKNNLFPEYDTLISYIIDKTSKYFDNFEVLELQEKYNLLDECSERRLLKEIRFNKIRNKYKIEDKHSNRMLLSILGVREVDDDWFSFEPSGSISVNSYGQLKIEEINKKYLTIFAHPTESKLDVVEKIINNTKMHGIEINVRNKYEDIDKLTNIINKYGLLITKGSDNHELNSNLYDNLSFYDMNNVEVEKLCH